VPARAEHYYYSYLPYPGHVAAPAFQRFHDDPTTCFLSDRCGLGDDDVPGGPRDGAGGGQGALERPATPR